MLTALTAIALCFPAIKDRLPGAASREETQALHKLLSRQLAAEKAAVAAAAAEARRGQSTEGQTLQAVGMTAGAGSARDAR